MLFAFFTNSSSKTNIIFNNDSVRRSLDNFNHYNATKSLWRSKVGTNDFKKVLNDYRSFLQLSILKKDVLIVPVLFVSKRNIYSCCNCNANECI